MAKLSTELQRYFFEEKQPEQIKLSDILSLAGERIFGFLFIILALPSALPIPAPGYSIPFGIVMFFLAVQLIIGRQRPWLPDKIINKSIKLSQAQGFVKAGMPWLKRIEALTHPRIAYVCTSVPGKIIIGTAIALMSICMMIPIPGTNTVPAMGIFIVGFGLQEEDGFISLAGLGVCLVALAAVVGILFTGVSILDVLIDNIKSLFGS